MAGLMEIRRAILQANVLPPEYERYDYLQTNTNKSYIDTGIAGNDNTIQMEFVFEPMGRANYSLVLGNYDGDRNHACWVLRHGSAAYLLNFTVNNRPIKSSSSVTLDVDTVVGKKIKIKMEYGSFHASYNGVDYTVNPAYEAGDAATTNIFIGNYPSIQSSAQSNRFYGDFKIKKGGKLVRNYVPVVRKSDDRAGFYDTVTHTFCPSIGQSDFTAGND